MYSMLVLDKVLCGCVYLILVKPSLQLVHCLKHLLLWLWEVATVIVQVVLEHCLGMLFVFLISSSLSWASFFDAWSLFNLDSFLSVK